MTTLHGKKKTKPQLIVIGIDIGSTCLRACASIYNSETDQTEVIAACQKTINGVSKGNITNPNEIGQSISDTISMLEQETSGSASHIYISLGCQSIDSFEACGITAITRADHITTSLDIDNGIREAELSISELRNFHTLHTVPIEYKVDGVLAPGQAEGIHGEKLEVRTLFIAIPNMHMDSIKLAIGGSQLGSDNCIAGPVAESLALITRKQKNTGVALINIGAQVSSLVVFEGGNPILLRNFAFGGDDITEEIALTLKITLDEAEALKCAKSPSPTNRKAIDNIINFGLRDLFQKVAHELEQIGKSEKLPAGVYITGNASLLSITESLAKEVLNLPVKRITNELAIATNNILSDPAFARAFGLTLIAPHDELEENNTQEFFQKIKKLFSKLEAFIP